MALSNSLVGGRPLPQRDSVGGGNPVGMPVVSQAPDGTEWAVATLVLLALGVLVLFRISGFQAVIAASVGKG